MKLLTRSEELVLLAVWSLRGNAYTISILKLLSEVTGYEWQLGAIYVPLEKLTRKGYLNRHKGESTPERGGRSKILYEMTAPGKKALKEIKTVHDTAWALIKESA